MAIDTSDIDEEFWGVVREIRLVEGRRSPVFGGFAVNLLLGNSPEKAADRAQWNREREEFHARWDRREVDR